MTTHTVDTLMAQIEDYAEEYSSAMVPQTKQAVIDSRDNLRKALTEALAQPVPPHECKTYEEKLAYAAGWWKALEANGTQPVQVPLTDEKIQAIYISEYNKAHHGRDFENLFARAIERAHHIGGDK